LQRQSGVTYVDDSPFLSVWGRIVAVCSVFGFIIWLAKPTCNRVFDLVTQVNDLALTVHGVNQTFSDRCARFKTFVVNNKWYIAASFVAISGALLALISSLKTIPLPTQQVLVVDNTLTPPANFWSYSRSAPSLSPGSKRAAGTAFDPAMGGLYRKMYRLHVTRRPIGGVSTIMTGFGVVLGNPHPGQLLTNFHTIDNSRGDIESIELSFFSTGDSMAGGKYHSKTIIYGKIGEPESIPIVRSGRTDVAFLKVPALTDTGGVYNYLLKTPYNEPPAKPVLLGFLNENDISNICCTTHPDQEFDYSFNGAPTVAGDCGRPLVGSYEGCLVCVGIHSAGCVTSNHGRSVRVTADAVDAALAGVLPSQSVLEPIALHVPGSIDDIQNIVDGQHIVVGPGNKHTGLEHVVDPLYNVEFIGNTGRLNDFETNFQVARYQEFFSDISGPPEKVPPKLGVREKDIGWLPISNYLKNVGSKPGHWDEAIIATCVKTLSVWLISRMTRATHKVGPLSTDEVINGVPNMPGLEGLNMKTGYGFPDNCKKVSKFRSNISADGSISYQLLPDQLDKYNNLITSLESGQAPSFVVMGVRKDEPIKPAKMALRGCRLIFAAPTLMTCCLRKYFGSLLHVLYMNRLSCGFAVGINCRNIEWTALYNYLTQAGYRCIAGDFGNFDQKLPAIITGSSLQVLLNVNLALGEFSPNDVVAMVTLLRSVLNHFVLIDSGLYKVCGPNPSGQALTTQTNCTSVLIMLLYVWISCGYEPELFFSECRFTTYGDDHVICVPPGWDRFNYDSIARCLASLGIDYTTFDKKSALGKDYDDIHSIQFLKCSFVVLPDFVAAPIDISSLNRRLQLCRISSSEELIERELDLMSSVWFDSFLHSVGDSIRARISLWFDSQGVLMDSGRFPSRESYLEGLMSSSGSARDYYGLDVPNYTLTSSTKILY
jgi:hypothetical protein